MRFNENNYNRLQIAELYNSDQWIMGQTGRMELKDELSEEMDDEYTDSYLDINDWR